MGQKTNIEWCDHSFSPWIGCSKVSPGCKNCYAETLDVRYYGGTHWGKGAPRKRTSESTWHNPIAWNKKAAQIKTEYDNRHDGTLRQAFRPETLPEEPHRPRVFPSLCDWLDDEVPIEWLADFLKLIHDTPNLNWLLLTKRPENFWIALTRTLWADAYGQQLAWLDKRPPQNVWIGVSVEDQKRADERIPQLLQIPAKVRFLSVEPLLSKINLLCPYCHVCKNSGMANSIAGAAHCTECDGGNPFEGGSIHWVIIGGESGKDRRDCGVEAICDVARQCVEADVPCFVKQASAFKPGQRGPIADDIWRLKQFPTIQY